MLSVLHNLPTRQQVSLPISKWRSHNARLLTSNPGKSLAQNEDFLRRRMITNRKCTRTKGSKVTKLTMPLTPAASSVWRTWSNWFSPQKGNELTKKNRSTSLPPSVTICFLRSTACFCNIRAYSAMWASLPKRSKSLTNLSSEILDVNMASDCTSIKNHHFSETQRTQLNKSLNIWWD